MICYSVVFCILTVLSRAIEPETGRVVIDPGSILDSDPKMRARAIAQLAEDEINREWTPNIGNGDLWIQHTSLGVLTLGNKLHTGATSTVFDIQEYPNWIIKYESDCNSGNSSHPLIRDFVFTNKVNSIGLHSPRAHFLSPPSLLCQIKDGKCGFRMPDADYEACRIHNRTLRYMILDRAPGMSLHEFRSKMTWQNRGIIGLRNAVSLGAKLIDMLQQLHLKAQVVHGDIHAPNIMISHDPVTKATNLGLIDFGLSFDYEPMPESPIRPPGVRYHRLHTIWQMAGFAWSARDDILKAVQTIAQIMHPFEYLKYEQDIADAGPMAMVEWKINGNWFLTKFFDPVSIVVGLSIHTRIAIHRLLGEVLLIARAIRINDAIPYTAIKTNLIEIARLVANSTSI